ncbi:hypothetical protein [Kitasatospora sp. NPDC096140]|uniref:hypothetical protein n=1 Tax=Kitasatospora sp. NPDC096140 TaxID=3155425 RepID=UPI0033283FF2
MRHALTYVLALAATAVLAGAASLLAISEWAADAPPNTPAVDRDLVSCDERGPGQGDGTWVPVGCCNKPRNWASANCAGRPADQAVRHHARRGPGVPARHDLGPHVWREGPV